MIEIQQSVSTAPVATPDAKGTTVPPHFFADIYTFEWSKGQILLPLVSAAAVGGCILIGIFAGHPGAGLICGGGAFTIGFGANQRIADSRIWPMILASFAMAISTMIGMLVGHHSFSLLAAAAGWGFVYGLMTTRASGIAWVGQQATISMLVASAFPANLHDALIRSSLILAGAMVQVVITSCGLRMLPELSKDLLAIPKSIYDVAERRRELLLRLRELPKALPALRKEEAFGYAIRVVITLLAATEMYRRLGVQSGYWIPMTAMLVQKPAFFETVARTLSRVVGTLAGAVLASIAVQHLQPPPLVLAAGATFFAFLGFATNGVNYALFTVCLSSYIVFLLGLNQLPGPEIAHRRAYCTIAGGLIAIVLHLDALLRRRNLDVE